MPAIARRATAGRNTTQDPELASRLAFWMGPFLEEVWDGPEFSMTPPPAHYRAALRFLLGCELVQRCGDVPELSFLGGPPESSALAPAMEAIARKVPLWEACAREHGFNPIVNLLATWSTILEQMDDPEDGVRCALRIPFHFRDPGCLEGIVARCTRQLRGIGDWFSLGFVKVHRWVDATMPYGPDPRMDPVSIALGATYPESPGERCRMAVVFVATQRIEDPRYGVRVTSDTIYNAFDWARNNAAKYPVAWEALVAEIEGDSQGPGLASLCRFYRAGFGDHRVGSWREDILEGASQYTSKRIHSAQLPDWCSGLALLRETLDFVVWADLVESYLCEKEAP